MGELQEPWDSAASRAGVRQTYRGIAERAGVSHVTVRRLIVEGRTSPSTIAKVAAALNVDEAKVFDWVGIELSELGPWVPPMEAHKLNPRARAALDELIRAIAHEGAPDADASPEKTADAPTPAPNVVEPDFTSGDIAARRSTRKPRPGTDDGAW